MTRTRNRTKKTRTTSLIKYIRECGLTVVLGSSACWRRAMRRASSAASTHSLPTETPHRDTATSPSHRRLRDVMSTLTSRHHRQNARLPSHSSSLRRRCSRAASRCRGQPDSCSTAAVCFAKPKFHYAVADFGLDTNHESPRTSMPTFLIGVAEFYYFYPQRSLRTLWRTLSRTFPVHWNGLNSIRATQTGLSRTCHGLCRKYFDTSR